MSDKLPPIHKRWPGEYAAKLVIYSPEGGRLEFITHMPEAYAKALRGEFINLVRGEPPRPEPAGPATNPGGQR